MNSFHSRASSFITSSVHCTIKLRAPTIFNTYIYWISMWLTQIIQNSSCDELDMISIFFFCQLQNRKFMDSGHPFHTNYYFQPNFFLFFVGPTKPIYLLIFGYINGRCIFFLFFLSMKRNRIKNKIQIIISINHDASNRLLQLLHVRLPCISTLHSTSISSKNLHENKFNSIELVLTTFYCVCKINY